MFKKMNQMVDHFPAFRKIRVKSAERMGQAGILRVVDQFMGHLMSAQSLFKIQSIALKIIVVTGDQETGWQTGHDVRVLPPAVSGRWKYQVLAQTRSWRLICRHFDQMLYPISKHCRKWAVSPVRTRFPKVHSAALSKFLLYPCFRNLHIPQHADSTYSIPVLNIREIKICFPIFVQIPPPVSSIC